MRLPLMHKAWSKQCKQYVNMVIQCQYEVYFKDLPFCETVLYIYSHGQSNVIHLTTVIMHLA